MLPFLLLHKLHLALLVVLFLLGTLFPVLFQKSLNFLLEDILCLPLAVLILVALFRHSLQITNFWLVDNFTKVVSLNPLSAGNFLLERKSQLEHNPQLEHYPNWKTTFDGRTDLTLWEKHTSLLGPVLESFDTTSSSIDWGATVSSYVRNTS
jgi:hypothetical protein